MARTAMVVVAGGSGTRVGAGRNKVLLPLGGRPVLAWSLTTFERSPVVDEVVVVTRGVDLDEVRRLVADRRCAKVRAVVEGGATRHASEVAGLDELAPAVEGGEVAVVGVHDAARPLVDEELVARLVAAAQSGGGAIPGLPVPGSALLHAPVGEQPRLLPAADLRAVQTPQVFPAAPLLAAYRRAAAEGVEGTDTAETFHRFTDLDVRVVPGDPRNLKITYPADLQRAATLARASPP